MSSICGILRPPGAPVEGAEIDAMLNALAHWPPDARGNWTGSGIGLGHLLLQTTPQSLSEVLPEYKSDYDLAITGDLRLDGREELAERFGIVPADLASWSDGRLVLRAYLEWGEDCPVHLLGDFAFAVWDGRRRQLFCARDVFGVKPLYYYCQGLTLAFASEMKGLLALPFVDRSIDETWIGDYLHTLSLDCVSTLYARIRLLAPCTALAFGPEGIRTWRYRELDPRRELHFSREEDYVDAFREKLETAIRRRTDTPFVVGGELSGGLDSAGICAIAQSFLRGAGRELHTFSQVLPDVVPEGVHLPEDGRQEIDLLCRHAGITRTSFLTGNGGILAAFEWARRYNDEPPCSFIPFYNHDLYEAAAGNSVRVLLSGFGGNQCVSAPARGRRRELLRCGQWAELWQDLSETADRRHPALAALGLVPGLFEGPIVDTLAKRTLEWKAYPTRATRDDFARRLGMWRRTFRANLRYSRGGTLREGAIRDLTVALARRLDCSNLSVAARRMEYRYPLLDLELVQFYLALPSRLKRRGGTGRYVFRRSLEPWVPDEVRMSVAHRSGNPGSGLQRRRDGDALIADLRSIPAGHPVLKYLEVDKLFVPPRIPGRHPRPRYTEILMALLLARKLDSLPQGSRGDDVA